MIQPREEMTLGELADYAAANIADGWEVTIFIKEGHCGVELIDLDNNLIEFCCDNTLEEQVKEAVAYSREHSHDHSNN